MEIRVYLNTRAIDYSGYKPIPKEMEIRDWCLKFHCYYKFEYSLMNLVERIKERHQRIKDFRQEQGIDNYHFPAHKS